MGFDNDLIFIWFYRKTWKLEKWFLKWKWFLENQGGKLDFKMVSKWMKCYKYNFKTWFFRLVHFTRKLRWGLYAFFLEQFARHNYCMMNYMDHDFRLWHSGYWIVMGYKWRVAAPSVKVHKLAQGLASALYRVLKGSTRVFVIWALWDLRCFYDLYIIFSGQHYFIIIFLEK